jgi:hypothetical protein
VVFVLSIIVLRDKVTVWRLIGSAVCRRVFLKQRKKRKKPRKLVLD